MAGANRAKEAKNGVNISFSIPKEGAMAFFDVFAMPADAKNKDEAYQFLNYLLRPDVIAHISDHVFYANANKEATALVSPEVRDNPGIYPPADVRAKLFTESTGSEDRSCTHSRLDEGKKREITRCTGHDPAGILPAGQCRSRTHITRQYAPSWCVICTVSCFMPEST